MPFALSDGYVTCSSACCASTLSLVSFKCLPASLLMKIILLILRSHIGAVTSSGSFFFPFALFLFFFNSVMARFKKTTILYCSVHSTRTVREITQKRPLEDIICIYVHYTRSYVFHLHICKCISVHMWGKWLLISGCHLCICWLHSGTSSPYQEKELLTFPKLCLFLNTR